MINENDDFKIVDGGGGGGGGFGWTFSILFYFSAKIQIKMFHTKFQQNRIINEDFKKIEEEGGTQNPHWDYIWKSKILGALW